jgi:probable selenium-dependent hydroxylase accessory protein YqeC
VSDRVDEDLASALGVAQGEMIAFVGAGGKTTAAWRLLGELADAGQSAVFTTTTCIFKPAAGDVALVLDPEPGTADLRWALTRAPTVVWAADAGERGESNRARRSPYPAEPVKLVGVAPGVVNRVSRELPEVVWLVEADGAKGRLLKAPASYEPVIPSMADRVVVVAALNAIGRPLGEETVHRPEIAARVLDTSTGARITLGMLAELIAHPQGGLKGIPAETEPVVLLTRWGDTSSGHGHGVAEHLLCISKIARVVEADLRGAEPVTAVWLR